MKKIFIVDIEALDNRYTKQWSTHIPQLLRNQFPANEIDVISGEVQSYDAPQAGAFFDFASTIEYKASQAQKIARLFKQGAVEPGDIFFFTDAWNQTVHSVKYLSELLEIPVHCVGIWHAGAYDPTDILGFTIQNIEWVTHLEKSYFHAYDMNFFGTKQHADKFYYMGLNNAHKEMIVGYPFEYLAELKPKSPPENKKRIVVFPHRLNGDKAPWVFDKIARIMKDIDPSISFVRTQDYDLPKKEYYNFLKNCSVVFSVNKHENLGIGVFEAMISGAFPLVPNKLSYKEMYPKEFKYDISHLRENEIYENDFNTNFCITMAGRIKEAVDNYNYQQIEEAADKILKNFFSFDRGLDYLETLLNV